MKRGQKAILAIGIFLFAACGEEGPSAKKGRGIGAGGGTYDQPRYFSDQFPVLQAGGATLDSKFPVRTGETSQIAVLGSGEQYLSARWSILSQAKSSVLIQYNIWKGDESGWAFAEKLIQLKGRGIRVHVLIDPLSNLSLQAQNMYSRLVNSGISVEGFQPLYQNVIAKYDSDLFNVFADANHRWHEKMFVVDGDLPGQGYAIVGGTNIGNEYFRMNQADPQQNWTDRDVILRGEIVQDVHKIWNDNLAEFKQQSTSNGFDGIASVIQDLFTKDAELDSTIEARVSQSAEAGAAIDQLAWHPAVMRFIQSRPKFNETFIWDTYVNFIRSARQEVILSNSYFLPSVQMQNELKAAAARGVRVRILTNSPAASDYPKLVTAARTLYKPLLEVNHRLPGGGQPIELFEWGGHQTFGNGEGLHHAKFGVFDRKAAIVGSYNLDPRSKNFNSEVVVAFENPAAVAPLVDSFNRETGPGYSSPISFDEAVRFKDPEGFLNILQTRFLEALIPIL